MDCKQVTSSIPDLIRDELSADVQQIIREHCETCESCARELNTAQEIWETLGEITDETPSPAMSARFHTMLEAYEKGMHSAPDKQPWYQKIWQWWTRTQRRPAIAMAAVFVIALSLGFFSGKYLGNLPYETGQMSELHQQIDDMQQTVSLLLLQQSSASQRLLGVSKSTVVSQPNDELLSSLLQTVNSDPNVNVRLAAVDALFLYRDRPEVRTALLNSLDMQQHPMVQIALINQLVAMRENRALQSLKSLLENDQINENVREQAALGIKELS